MVILNSTNNSTFYQQNLVNLVYSDRHYSRLKENTKTGSICIFHTRIEHILRTDAIAVISRRLKLLLFEHLTQEYVHGNKAIKQVI